MTRLSLRLRSFTAALVTLMLFIPLAGITLERAFTSSLSESMLERLRISSLSLISTFELKNGKPALPEQLFNDLFNIPGSGVYAFVQIGDEIVWQSLSTLNWQKTPRFTPPPLGEERFLQDYELVTPYFLYAYSAEFESGDTFVPVSFFVLQDRFTFDNERDAFAETLWNWLTLIALILLVLLLVSLNAALSPINTLIGQIKDAESGKLQRISERYPPELEKLKSSLNHLLDTEQQQRERYKNSLSDLAHSLKTPLAVLSGTARLPAEANEPLRQIQNLIERQLKRAVAGAGSGWEQAIPVGPVVNKLCAAMEKVYADRALHISSDIDKQAHFKGDRTDLLELLGNIIDNACKAAVSKVHVEVSVISQVLDIKIDDDGAGIAIEHRQQLLTRGVRLDSYQEGQGIGMAIASDLIAAYEGKMEILDSPMGGARIHIQFPI